MAYATNASDIPPPPKKRRVEIEIDESTPSSSSATFSSNTVAAAASDLGVGVGFSTLSNKQFKKSGKKSNTLASASTSTSAAKITTTTPSSSKKEKKKKKLRRPPLPTPCSPDDVRFNDIRSLLGPSVVQRILDRGTGEEWDSPVEVGQEVEVVVSELGCSGDAMSIYHPPPLPTATTQLTSTEDSTPSQEQKPWILITPFALPNERILVRVYKNDRLCSYTDLVRIVEPNYELRSPKPKTNSDGSGSGSGSSSSVKCKYFGECGGCQYQMIPYQTQLDLKQRVILKAYTYYSGFASEEMPYIPPPSHSSSSYPISPPVAAAAAATSSSSTGAVTASSSTLIETSTSTSTLHSPSTLPSTSTSPSPPTSFQPRNGTRIPILPTQGSALQYAYRTKITPHFQVPRWWGRYVRNQRNRTDPKGGKGNGNQKGRNQKEEAAAAVAGEPEERQEQERETGVDAGEREGEGEMAGVDAEMGMDVEATAPNLDWLKIGFNHATRGRCVDIEECPIATRTINNTLPTLRADVVRNPERYTRGATLLLRDSVRVDGGGDGVRINGGGPIKGGSVDVETHVCVTDPKGTIRERVRVPAPPGEGEGEGKGGRTFEFEFNASAFFQNNNSIIGVLVAYVRNAMFDEGSPRSYSASSWGSTSASTSTSTIPDSDNATTTSIVATAPAPTNLIDAYCGSGLFSITLSEDFDNVVGIEISEEGVRSARRNAELNRFGRGAGVCAGASAGASESASASANVNVGGVAGTGTERLRFIKGDASNIFDSVKDFESRQTAVIIDPPRKGCDIPFLTSLLAFAPQTIVYVSCNVHTQARDVGVLVRGGTDNGSAADDGNGNGDVQPRGARYRLDSLRGFDMFPQTAHVESVAVLRLVD